MAERIYIVGASVRAAAFSALRGGFDPMAVDCFADFDLAARCHAVAVTDYPSGVLDVLAGQPRGDWLYTGAFENYPELVSAISRHQNLQGNPADVLARVRDPWLLSETLRDAGFAVPEVRPIDQSRPVGNWLFKRRASAAGLHVLRADDSLVDQLAASGNDEWYVQQYVCGVPYSAVFLADGDRAVLLGITRQWIGPRELGSQAFHYAGSLGPVHLPRAARTLRSMGCMLARHFALRGLFGLDFIWHGRTVWPVELNPRYTASCEILERALRRSLIADHLAACAGRLKEGSISARGTRYGKAILFARRTITIPDRFPISTMRRLVSGRWPNAADLPHPGQTIEAGHPVMTLLDRGSTIDGVRIRLLRRARRVQQILGC